MSDEEIFKEIEELREAIVAQNRPIEIVDFGAGAQGERTKEEMEKGVVRSSSSEFCKTGLKGEWAKKIYMLVKEKKPKTILELGTCCGFSSAYMSKASPDSSIKTVEGAPALAAIARENHKKLGCENIEVLEGRFIDVLPKLLPSLNGVDFAFIDGHHDRDATINYFTTILPYLNPWGVMVFDDIAWSEGMKEAWDFIRREADAKEVITSSKLGILYFGESFRCFYGD